MLWHVVEHIDGTVTVDTDSEPTGTAYVATFHPLAGSVDKMRRNARLAAAAPELLAACVKLLRLADSLQPAGGPEQAEARAVIKKAGGGK